MITFQFAYLIPYTVTKTYVSEQNVPHTVVIGKEYDVYNSTRRYEDKSGNYTSKMIDLPILALQFAITTLIAFLFYRFIRTKEDTNLQDSETATPEIADVEPEEIQPKPRKRKRIIKRVFYVIIVLCLCTTNLYTYFLYANEVEEKIDAYKKYDALKDEIEGKKLKLTKSQLQEIRKAANQQTPSTPQPQQQVVVIHEEEDNKCEYPRCNFTKSLSGDCCIMHTCKRGQCYERVVSGSSYCSEHKCLAPDCNNSRSNGSYFCFTHSR